MKTKQVESQFVDFPCDSCGKGAMRLPKKRRVIMSSVPQWLHVCSYCEKQVYLTKPFPFLRYKGRDFFMSELPLAILKQGEPGKPDSFEFE